MALEVWQEKGEAAAYSASVLRKLGVGWGGGGGGGVGGCVGCVWGCGGDGGVGVDEYIGSTPFLPVVQFRTPVYGPVLLTVEVVFPPQLAKSR